MSSPFFGLKLPPSSLSPTKFGIPGEEEENQLMPQMPQQPMLPTPAPPEPAPISIPPQSEFPGSPSLARYQQHLDSMPQRADYAPSKSQKIAAALVGSLVNLGSKDPNVGLKLTESIADKPYLQAMEAFNATSKGLHELASQENLQQDNLRQFMAAQETSKYHTGMLAQRDEEEEGRLQRADASNDIQALTQDRLEAKDEAADADRDAAEAGKQERFKLGEAGKNSRSAAILAASAKTTKKTKVPIGSKRRARKEARKNLSEGKYKGILTYNKEKDGWELNANAGSSLEEPGVLENAWSLGNAKKNYKEAAAGRAATLKKQFDADLKAEVKKIMKKAGYEDDEEDDDMDGLLKDALNEDDEDE